jgi:hypothetical protein
VLAYGAGCTRANAKKKLAKKAPPALATGPAVEIKWKELYKMDVKTGKVPASLRKLHGKRVKIAGFIVPLDDEYETLSEFLIVPDSQSCIHVPPPPPNLIIHSKMVAPIRAEKAYNPAWAFGTFKIEKTTSKYGAAGYKMTVEKLKEYVFPQNP